MQVVNERTASEFSVSIRGSDGSIATPTTLKYRVDCLTTSQSIVSWTSLTPAAVNTISVTGAQNAIRDDANSFEDKQVSVMADEGLSSQQTQTFTYRVKNLYGTP